MSKKHMDTCLPHDTSGCNALDFGVEWGGAIHCNHAVAVDCDAIRGSVAAVDLPLDAARIFSPADMRSVGE
jgi:hypothetical protein